MFLPICLIGLVIVRKHLGPLQIALYLICGSFVFYMYWNPLDVLFVWLSVIVNFYISRSTQITKSAKLIGCVTFNAGYLLALKIFVSSGAGSASNEALAFSALGLPLGISFITFQQISFVVDQAKGRDEELSFSRYLFL